MVTVLNRRGWVEEEGHDGAKRIHASKETKKETVHGKDKKSEGYGDLS